MLTSRTSPLLHNHGSLIPLDHPNTHQAIAQIRSTASLTHNLAQCTELVRRAAAAGASALFLPEASDYIASNPAQSLSLAQPTSTSPFVQGLLSAARTHRLPLCVGIHEPSTTSQKVQNTLLWIDETGTIAHRYQKLHLFDVDIADGPVLKESNGVERGSRIEDPIATPLGKVGLLICFDLRFPEPAIALRRRGAQILTYPSAFTVPTGKAHWETLLRARAIETQSYVIAAAQVGFHNEEKTRRSYGHGMIVDPWGKVVARLGGEEDEEGRGLDVGEVSVALWDGYMNRTDKHRLRWRRLTSSISRRRGGRSRYCGGRMCIPRFCEHRCSHGNADPAISYHTQSLHTQSSSSRTRVKCPDYAVLTSGCWLTVPHT